MGYFETRLIFEDELVMLANFFKACEDVAIEKKGDEHISEKIRSI